MKGILAAFAALVISLGVDAQDSWPSKPVKFIVPSSPGGGTDLYARILAQALGESLKQQFIVDNRPGASGNVGAAAAAKSVPDGYTLCFCFSGPVSLGASDVAPLDIFVDGYLRTLGSAEDLDCMKCSLMRR